jgi:hypothetical protein
MLQSKISRRQLLGSSIALGVAPFMLSSSLSGAANAAAPPVIDPNDPTAKALGFVNDAKSVDAAANTTFKPTQKCATCVQYQGKAGDPLAPCTIFGGKSVPAAGWCKVWALKPGS